MAKIATHNTKIYYATSFFRSLYFTVPVWILLLQGRISTSEISILVGFGSLVQLVLELPTGAFADIFGKKITVFLSYLCDAVSFLFYAFATTFPHFLILTTFSGIGDALRSGAKEALIYDSLKQDGEVQAFSHVTAHQTTYFQIGITLATLTGGFLFELDYHLPFVLCGLSQLISAALSLRFIEPSIDSVQFTLKNYILQMKLGVKEAFKTQAHRLISWYYIAVGSISWLVMTYYTDFLLIDLGFDSGVRGIIGGSLRVLNLVLLARVLTQERIFTKTMTILFFPILLITSLTPGIWLSGWWGVPSIAGAMMSSTARWVLLGKYTNAVFDSRYRATAISTLSMGISIIYVGFTMLSGPIMESFGGSRTIFTLLGIISLIVIPPLAYKIIHIDQTHS